ncbi:hypothetical protein [Mesorhizobium sp. M0013]|uniref:hypothetical protein n=1 Tax=Mesorhizobium sp. M0013 TaxID=2956841 RepID=UPI00333572DA
MQHTPQPLEGLNAIEAVSVQRNQSRKRLIGPRVTEQENRDRVDAPAMKQAQSVVAAALA